MEIDTLKNSLSWDIIEAKSLARFSGGLDTYVDNKNTHCYFTYIIFSFLDRIYALKMLLIDTDYET